MRSLSNYNRKQIQNQIDSWWFEEGKGCQKYSTLLRNGRPFREIAATNEELPLTIGHKRFSGERQTGSSWYAEVRDEVEGR